ncbi:MAG: hypothetical protein IT352_15790 [Gemmatimonadales bacterium]|nr:hypothetical protein [Gemmatimonadales bacterium]
MEVVSVSSKSERPVKAPSRRPPAKPWQVSQQELAELLGISTRQVRNLEAVGLPSRSTKGRKCYDAAAAVAWYLAYKVPVTSETMKAAELRRTVAAANLAELRFRREAGELVPVADAVEVVERMLGQLRSQLVTLPQRWAPRLVGVATVPAATALLDQAVHDALTALSSETFGTGLSRKE